MSTISMPNNAQPARLPPLVDAAAATAGGEADDDDDEVWVDGESTTKSLTDRLYTYDSPQIIAIKLNALAVTRTT